MSGLEQLETVEAIMSSNWSLPSLTDMLGRPAWQARAACRDEDINIFFARRGSELMEARRICRSCEVADECLHYALDRPALRGIWGGTSERTRQAMRANEAIAS